MLITLRYADELRETSGLDVPADGLKGAGVTPKEVELAKRLIEDMSEHWESIGVPRYVSRRPDAAHRREDQGRRDRSDH